LPVIIAIHPGLVTWSEERLKNYILNVATSSRFLAAGYVVLATTYRGRDHDPQSTTSLQDCLAAIDHVRRLPFVDPNSLVVYGSGGGGDLALEVAATSQVCAIVPEEPASFIFAGIFNSKFPRKGERLAPEDALPIVEQPKRFYTLEYQELTRAKIARITCPILILQSDQDINVSFNNQVLIPELRSAGKTLEVVRCLGESHCLGFSGLATQGGIRKSSQPGPAAALKAFHAVDAFLKRHLPTKPHPMDSRLVKLVALPPA